MMATSIFTGCGSSKDTKTATNLAKTSVKNTTKTLADYKGTIKIWSWNTDLKDLGIIDKFNKVYPNLKVELVSISNDNSAYN